MTNKYTRLIAKVTAVATVLATFAVVNPVLASAPTSMSDTLTREKVSITGVSHTLTLTLPADLVSSTITFDYNTPGFASVSATPGVTCGTGTATAASATNLITVTGSGACSGLLTVTFTATNPSSPGSKLVSIAGTAGDTGTYAIPIVSEDQISVTASVNASITFAVGADTSTCNSSWTPSAYTVALGTLTTGAVTRSDTGGIAHICTLVSTNATSGVVVTVKSTNSALQSTAVPGDQILSTNGTMSAGTANYGLCDTTTHGAAASTPPSSLPLNLGNVFSATNCGLANATIVAFDSTSQSVWHTASQTNAAYYQLDIEAAISGTTLPHADYGDTLTWIATATF